MHLYSCKPLPTSNCGCLHYYPTCQQLCGCLTTEHRLLHLQGQFSEFSLQSHLHIAMNSASTKQSFSTQKHRVDKASSWSDPLPAPVGQHNQEDQQCMHNPPLLQKCWKLQSLIQSSVGLQPPELHGYKLREVKWNWSYLYLNLLHTSTQNV